MLNEIDLYRIDLNLLVLFEVVMAERHVGRSGLRLNLSPSAVSHGLGRLRAVFGDPLFLRTPKGVVPTARAVELAPSIADILARVKGVVATRQPFDPASSSRRFTIGAPDGVTAVILPPLLDMLGQAAPKVDIGIRQLLPRQGDPSPRSAWLGALAELDERELDLAIIPMESLPARFDKRLLYEEDFVVAMRKDHPFARDPGLPGYCASEHLVVSHAGEPHGFVDVALGQLGQSRRVALTVPNFMLALAVLAEGRLISALPRRFVAGHGPRFGLVAVEAPVALPRFELSIVAPRVALLDAGLAWLVDMLESTVASVPGSKPATPEPLVAPRRRKPPLRPAGGDARLGTARA